MKKSAPLLIAFLCVAIDLLGFGIVLPLTPLYTENFLGGIPKEFHGATIGALLSVFSLMQFLFSPGWGRLSDRIGRRPVLMIGLGGSVVFYLLFGFATYIRSLELLFLSRIGAGIAGATIGTAQAVIADSTPPERRAKGMALIGVAFGIGFTFGPLIGSLFASDIPGHPMSAMPGFVAAGLSLVAFILAVFRLPETRPTGGVTQPRPWFNIDGWKLALGHRAVAVPLVVFFIATLAFGNFEATLARYVKNQLTYSLREMGYVFAYVGFVLMLTQGLIVRRLVTRVGEVVMVVIGIVLMMAGLLTVAAFLDPDTRMAVLGFMSLAVMGFAFLTPSAQALVSRRTSALRQGEVLGVNQAAAAIARILGPLMGNILYGSQENPHASWPFYAGAALLGAALLIAGAFLRQRDDPPPEKEMETKQPGNGNID